MGKTFKNRGINKTSNKLVAIQKLCGVFNIQVQIPYHNKLIQDHYDKKPKTFSIYNWLYPFIVALNIKNPEKEIENFRNWVKIKDGSVEVEVSCRLQHMSMCLDSPHFTSCGGLNQLMKELADYKMLKPYSFCIFTRDKSGKVDNRCFCEFHKNRIYIYSFYGNNKHLFKVFVELLTKVSDTLVIEKNSWI